MKRALKGAAVLISASSLGLFATAQRKPPPQLYEACAGAAEGDPCTAETPRGPLEGTCKYLPDDEQLVCWPNAFSDGSPRKR